jgi:hypothetical protein
MKPENPDLDEPRVAPPTLKGTEVPPVVPC